jgi:hypothetical protein
MRWHANLLFYAIALWASAEATNGTDTSSSSNGALVLSVSAAGGGDYGGSGGTTVIETVTLTVPGDCKSAEAETVTVTSWMQCVPVSHLF